MTDKMKSFDGDDVADDDRYDANQTDVCRSNSFSDSVNLKQQPNVSYLLDKSDNIRCDQRLVFGSPMKRNTLSLFLLLLLLINDDSSEIFPTQPIPAKAVSPSCIALTIAGFRTAVGSKAAN